MDEQYLMRNKGGSVEKGELFVLLVFMSGLILEMKISN
jgi:hypothetical protein